MSIERRLSVELSPSGVLAGTIVAIHALAGACAALALSGPGGAVLALLLPALGVAAAWDRALLRGRKSVTGMVIEGPASLRLRTRDGRETEVRATGRKHVSRLAVIVPVRGSMRRTIVVVRDMLDAESFRRLRLWALWGKVPGAGPDGRTAIPA
ncbi:MAG TPA: protein YgfX [Burkholderiales bacterium]|nr:protein YgfX [Burkholderiales bacterium]